MKTSRRGIVFTLAFLVLSLASFNHFVSFVERRPGVVLDDPVLRALPVANLQGLTFFLIYGCLGLALFVSTRRQSYLVLLAQAYAWLLWFRMAAMAIMPLDPPAQMIALRDPLVELFGSQRILTKDLFFSGQTATLFLLFLFARHFAAVNVFARKTMSIFLAATFGVAGCVLAQHVHYAIDVMAAPLFSAAVFRFTLWLNRCDPNPAQ